MSFMDGPNYQLDRWQPESEQESDSQNSKFPDPVSSQISDLCEISDLLSFFSYLPSAIKEIKSGNFFFDVCCIN